MSSQFNADSWANSCLRKKAMSEDIASKVVKRAISEGDYLRKYLCPHCQKYHVTTKPLNPEYAKGGNNGR